jgi:hypothetical protein
MRKKKVTLILLAKEKSKRQHAPRTDPNICRARSGAHAEFDEREMVSVQNGNRIRKLTDRAADRSNRSFTSQHGNPKDPLPCTEQRAAYSPGDGRWAMARLGQIAGCFVAVMAAGRSRHGLRLFYFHLLACHTPINGEGAHNGAKKMKQWLTYKNLNL